MLWRGQLRITVAQYLEQWLNAVRPTLADGTVSNYDRVIRLQINPRLGGVQLAKLTQRLTHIVLQLALDRAVKWGLVPRNVCDAAESPAVTESVKFRVLTKDQVEKLLETAERDRLEALYVVAVTTGMRLGELLGLECSNVNLDQGDIQVTHVLNEVHGKLKIKEPKTASSRRQIDLPQIAIDALRKHRERLVAEEHGSRFVFVNEHGDWWRRSHFHSQCFKPLLAKAGLPKIRFHDLRHTCATLLLQDDVHPKVVQERLGHSKISITLDTFRTLCPRCSKPHPTRSTKCSASVSSACSKLAGQQRAFLLRNS